MAYFRAVLPVLFLFFSSPFGAQAQGVFEQGKSSHKAQILGGQIALILDERVFEDGGDRRVLAGLDAKPMTGMPQHIVVVRGPDTQDEAEIKKFGLDVMADQPDLILDTGSLILMDEARHPAVMTGQVIVQISKDQDADFIEKILEEFDARIVERNPFDARQFVIETGEERATLEISNAINAMPETDFAQPNFYMPTDLRQSVTPNDAFFADQWHLDNTGQSGGTEDADIDADQAWSFTTGDPDIVIAIFDGGTQGNHPDLVNNLWTNTGETAGDGVDNDNNGFVDDVNGWDFTSCTTTTPCGDANPAPTGAMDNHGTAVTGSAVAQQENAIGVSGSCPNCSFLPLRGTSGSNFGLGLAFNYAQAIGADVINNSWGFSVGTPLPAVLVTAINQAANNGRNGRGMVVLWAMNNVSNDDCVGANPDLSSLANVIAVSRVTNQDRFNPGGFGDCMDVLAPTHGGTLWGVTTDRTGTAGYNNSNLAATCPSTEPSSPPANRGYTFCFNGSSFATPVVAGVVGLMLSVDNTLTRLQVQQALQDTADKPEDSLGQYAETTGFSTPTGVATHGFGRVNAFEAVRQVAPAGRAGRDVMIRDNRLDWGNTEQPSNVLMEPTRGFIAHYRSVDIKVDAAPFASSAPTTSAQFDAFTHENPLSGQQNRVYVRVHNRGHLPVNDVTVKLHWAYAGAGLPALPADFWPAFPADASDTSVWNPIPAQVIPTVGYSGASVAGGAGDGSVIRVFDFNAPIFDASLANPDHYCLFVVLDAPDDPVSASSNVPDVITPRDNNVTHRNVQLQDSGRSERSPLRMVVNNPFEFAITTFLRANAPKGWKVDSDGLALFERFRLEPGDSKMAEIAVFPSEDFARGEVDIQQIYLDPKTQAETVLGGTVIEMRPKRQIRVPGFKLENVALMELLRRHQRQIDLHQGLISDMMKKDGAADPSMLTQLGKILEGQGQLLLRVGEE